MKSIFIHVPDKTACGYYRATLPYKFCKDKLAEEGIELYASENINTNDFEKFDAFMFHRFLVPGFLDKIKQLKANGKKIIQELDDDLWAVPPWNPAHNQNITSQANLDILNWTLDEIADAICVTNNALAERVNRTKTWVCPNLVDLSEYPRYKENVNNEVRILWAGSNHHCADLDLITDSLMQVLDKHPQVQVLFFGDIPDRFATFKRIRNSNLGVMAPLPNWGNRLGFIPPVPLKEYPKILASIEPNICLCPLEKNVFNESKSNIKYLEYTCVNGVTIASDIGPYKDIKGLHENWLDNIEKLLDKEVRDKISLHARIEVESDWSWQNSKKVENWLDMFRSVVWM